MCEGLLDWQRPWGHTDLGPEAAGCPWRHSSSLESAERPCLLTTGLRLAVPRSHSESGNPLAASAITYDGDRGRSSLGTARREPGPEIGVPNRPPLPSACWWGL